MALIDDESIMVFGKYSGQKLGAIPASYWLHMYNEKPWFKEQYPAYADYVKRNKKALEIDAEYEAEERADMYGEWHDRE